MIDIINAHVSHYNEIVLITGFLNPRETPLNSKVKVIMCKSYNRSSTFSRFFSWFLFWLQSFFFVFIKYRNYNLYFVTNPPLNIFLAKLVKRPFAYLIYDIYPEALSKYSYLSKNSYIYKNWIKTNYKVYGKAKKLFTLSEGMKEIVLNYGLPKEKIDVIPVWTSADFFKNIKKKDNLFLKKNNIENKFIVGYSGNLGISHPVEKLVELANLFKDNSDVTFIIIGEGEKKNLLYQYINDFDLDNVKLFGYQETDLFPHVLHSFDVGVVTLDSKASLLSVPSKTYNLMSAGKPLLGISSQNSELSKLITDNDIGKNFEDNDLEGMKVYVDNLKDNSSYYQFQKTKSYELSHQFTSDLAKKMVLI
jgi:hypothetical protein